MQKGKVIIFSAPSGAGKSTIVRHLLEHNKYLTFSISATTRGKRPGEEHGKHYYFLSKEEFLQKVADGEFVEYEQVYKGIYYGTLKTEVDRIRDAGKSVVLDVDVRGALHLKDFYQQNALAVYVKPPGLQALAERLKGRNTENKGQLEQRLGKASYEMSFEENFDEVVLNDNLEDALRHASEVVDKFLNLPR